VYREPGSGHLSTVYAEHESSHSDSYDMIQGAEIEEGVKSRLDKWGSKAIVVQKVRFAFSESLGASTHLQAYNNHSGMSPAHR
jgi:hypothetical protein